MCGTMPFPSPVHWVRQSILSASNDINTISPSFHARQRSWQGSGIAGEDIDVEQGDARGWKQEAREWNHSICNLPHIYVHTRTEPLLYTAIKHLPTEHDSGGDPPMSPCLAARSFAQLRLDAGSRGESLAASEAHRCDM